MFSSTTGFPVKTGSEAGGSAVLELAQTILGVSTEV